MIRYKAKSWSESARFVSNKMYNYYISGTLKEEDVVKFFQNSYRAPLIVHRAAKRFGRMVRKYKRKEN